MCPIYEIRSIDEKGRMDLTRMYGGIDMISHLNELVNRGWHIISCVIV